MIKQWIIFLALSSIIGAHAQPLIESIELDTHSITYHLNEQFHATYLREDLFVSYQDDIDLTQLDYTIITMPLIMNTIAMVWVSGKDYFIDAMDKDLYKSLEVVKEVFRRFYPATSFDGDLIPKTLVDNSHRWKNNSQRDGIALPFSHGLDSLCTSMRHHTTPQLLITARGMPDTPLDYWNTNWNYTQKAISRFAQIHNHKTSYISSNFHEFFNWQYLCTFSKEIANWRLCVVEGLGWMGLAAPILITKGYKTFMLPANGDWHIPHPGADCPLVVENVSFAGITNICDGFEISRMEKNEIVADICNTYNLEKPVFIICEKILKNRKNCCECQKCAASILALLLLNEDPQEYGFDIPLSDFFHYFKTTFIQENEYEDYAAGWFKQCQQKAHKQLHKLKPELQEFFTWYITLDFVALPYDYITIDYNNFTDLYDNIPEEVLKRCAHMKGSCVI